MLLSLHPNIIVHVESVVSLFSSPPLAHKKCESVAAINLGHIHVCDFSSGVAQVAEMLLENNVAVITP